MLTYCTEMSLLEFQYVFREVYIKKISGEPAEKFDMLTRILSEHNIRSYSKFS